MKQLMSGQYADPKEKYVPFFETVIRYLGGLLSAHALSNEPILLKKADELATKLAPVFNTPTGLTAFEVNTLTYVAPPLTCFVPKIIFVF